MVSHAHQNWMCHALFVAAGLLACNPTHDEEPSTARRESTAKGQDLASMHDAPRGPVLSTAGETASPDPSATSVQPSIASPTSAAVITAGNFAVTTLSKPSASTRVKPPTAEHSGREVPPSRQPTSSSTIVRGSPHTGEGFRVYLQTSSPVVLGQAQPFTVVIEPQAPYKSNEKYPYRFAGLTAQGVALSANTVTDATVTPSRTTLQVNATGKSAGEGTLSGTLSFSVCTAEKCLVERASLMIGFTVVAN